jgi:signal transduction histidine kinase
MNETELLEIINNIPQMIWKIKVNNNNIEMLFANKSWSDYTNNTTNIFDNSIVHPDDISSLINKKGSFSVKRRLRDNKDIYHWFLTRAVEGETGIWFGSCTDIEQVVIAEETRIELAETVANDKEFALKTRQIEKDISETIRITLFDKANLLSDEKDEAETIRIKLAKGVERDKKTAEKIRLALIDKANFLENETEGAKILANEVVEKELEKEVAEKVRLILFEKAKVLANEKDIADGKRIALEQERGIAEATRIELSKHAKVLADKAITNEFEKYLANERRVALEESAEILANDVIEKEQERGIAEETRLELSKHAQVLADKAITDEFEKDLADERRIALKESANILSQEREVAEKTRIELSRYAQILANKALEKEFEKEIAEKVRVKLSEYAEVLAIRVLKKDVEKNIAEHTRIVLSNHAKVLAGEVLITNELLHQMQLDKLSVSESHELQNKANMETMAEMSHEIRNPLNGVIGIVGLLADSDLRPDIREYVDSLKEASTMLLNVVTDVLDISKLDSGKLEVECIEYKPSDILADMFMVYLSITHSKGITLINECDNNLIVNGDPQKIKQILNNLISNAIKFTSDGSITIRVNVSDDFIYYYVVDTGIGISNEHLKKLFKPFSQANSSISRLYGGSGLGLHICKKLASLMLIALRVLEVHFG